MRDLITKTAASLSIAGALTGDIALAAPAEASTVRSYEFAEATLTRCRAELSSAIHDFKAQGIYKSTSGCYDDRTGGANRWRAAVYYYIR